jgi:hypothetical protein
LSIVSQGRRLRIAGAGGNLHDVPSGYLKDPIGYLDQCGLVADRQDGQLAAQFLQGLADRRFRCRIQSAGCFIKDQQLRSMDQCSGNGYPLTLPS